MRAVARSRGVELILLDHTKPLVDQGEYDAIVHKLQGPNMDWERNLQAYIEARPSTKVIDSLAGIRIVHNRATMLLPLLEHPEGIIFQDPEPGRNGTSMGVGGCSCARVQSPSQVEIPEGTSLGDAQSLLRSAGLAPPLLVKPLWTDGRAGSHGLAVLHDMGALGRVLRGGLAAELKPPLVVQQFVEHGGVLFKVYVLGHRTVVCRRPSLGESYLGPEARAAGVLSLPRVSCKSTYAPGSPELHLAAGALYSSCGSAASGGGWTGGSAGACGRGGLAGSTADCSADAPPPLHHLQQHPHLHTHQLHTQAHHQPHARTQPQHSSPPAPAPAPSQQGQHPQQHPQRQPPAAPPDWMTSALAGTLREKLGLQLFNFDLICPEEQADPGERLYYVVDINYFPGVDKIPDFEHIFVDFLKDAMREGQAPGPSPGPAPASPCGRKPPADAPAVGGVREAAAPPACGREAPASPAEALAGEVHVSAAALPCRRKAPAGPLEYDESSAACGGAAAALAEKQGLEQRMELEVPGAEREGKEGGARVDSPGRLCGPGCCAGEDGGGGGDDGLSSVPSNGGPGGEQDQGLGAEAPSAPAAEVTSRAYQTRSPIH